MSTSLIKAGETPVTALNRLLKSNEAAIKAVIPEHFKPERLIRLAVTAVHQTPALQNCSMVSICNSVMLAAQLGLEINNGMGHGWLIPYKGMCTFQPGYRGLIDLAVRTGLIHDVQAHVVYENDVFELEYGDGQKCVHKPTFKDRGEWIGAYCHVRYKDGPPSSLFLLREEIEKIRDRSSQTWRNEEKRAGSVWTIWEDEMVRKTPTKRHLKYVKLSNEISYAVGLDDQAEAHAARLAEDNGQYKRGDKEVAQDLILDAQFLDQAEQATDALKGSVERQEEVKQQRLEEERAKAEAPRRGRPPKSSAEPATPPPAVVTSAPVTPQPGSLFPRSTPELIDGLGERCAEHEKKNLGPCDPPLDEDILMVLKNEFTIPAQDEWGAVNRFKQAWRGVMARKG